MQNFIELNINKNLNPKLGVLHLTTIFGTRGLKRLIKPKPQNRSSNFHVPLFIQFLGYFAR